MARRHTGQLLRRLGAALATPELSAGGWVARGSATHLLAAHAAVAAAPAAAAGLLLPPGWRPFSAAAAAAEDDAAAAAEVAAPVQQQQPREPPRRQPHRVWTPAPVIDPEAPIARIARCGTVAEQRALQAELAAAGAFGPIELGAAMRRLMTQEPPGRERTQYLRELLAAGQQMPDLDPKAAAYLAWGPARAKLRGRDPAVADAVATALRHVGGMQSNDLTTLLWALGVLGVQPTAEQRDQLLARLLEVLPAAKSQELTAAAMGARTLRLHGSFGPPIVAAFEARLAGARRPRVALAEATRLIKLLPHIPGMGEGSTVAAAVFNRLLDEANHISITTLADMLFAAQRINFQLTPGQLQHLLACVERNLWGNRGAQVQSVLRSLQMMGRQCGDGIVNPDFVDACVAAQVAALSHSPPGVSNTYVGKFLAAVKNLGAELRPELAQQLLDKLQADGLGRITKPGDIQAAFRHFGFQPGVEALEPFTNYEQRKQQGRRRQQQQQQQQHDEMAAPLTPQGGEQAEAAAEDAEAPPAGPAE